MMENTGIYRIVNLVNNQCYIGSAISLSNRKSVHFTSLRTGVHHNLHLQRSWNKYGEDCFAFEILLYCEKQMLLYNEQLLIEQQTNAFNICKVAGSSLGRKCSEETKKKLRIARKKQNNPRIGTMHSEETKKKLSTFRRNFFTRPESEKARLAIIKSNKSRETDEFREKRTNAIRAFYADPVRSAEARKKISEAGKARQKQNR